MFKKQQNKTRLKTKFQYWYFVVFIHVVLRTDAVTRTQNRLSFICERARKVAKHSLMLKINRLEKRQTTPLKFDSDPK